MIYLDVIGEVSRVHSTCSFFLVPTAGKARIRLIRRGTFNLTYVELQQNND